MSARWCSDLPTLSLMASADEGPRADPRARNGEGPDPDGGRRRGTVESGTHHLQAATLELIAAARAVLDVLEDFVEDPERIKEAAEAASSTVGDVVSLGRQRPAARNPWFDDAWRAQEDAGPDRAAPRPDDTADSSVGEPESSPQPRSRATPRGARSRPSRAERPAGFERVDLG